MDLASSPRLIALERAVDAERQRLMRRRLARGERMPVITDVEMDEPEVPLKPEVHEDNRVCLKSLPGIPQGTICRIVGRGDHSVIVAVYYEDLQCGPDGEAMVKVRPRNLAITSKEFQASFRKTTKPMEKP